MTLSPVRAASAILHEHKRRLWEGISHRKRPDGFEDPAPFLSFLGVCKTKDEKDLGKVKPFPVHKEYIQRLASWFVDPRLPELYPDGRSPFTPADPKIQLAKKSRQMTVSWLAIAYCAWRGYTLPNQLIVWQCRNEEDAAEMVFDKDDYQVARMSFLCWHLPRWAFDLPKGSYGKLLWPNGSMAKISKQGPDVIRQKATSLIVSDEMAFQEQAANAYTAARPAVSGGGQFIGISSANPGFFWDAAEDNWEPEEAA